jgi:hypothetical protein
MQFILSRQLYNPSVKLTCCSPLSWAKLGNGIPKNLRIYSWNQKKTQRKEY